MKVLLDTSFLRHLEIIQKTELIEKIYSLLNWEFCIAQTVFDELNQKYVEKSLQNLLDKKIIFIEECGQSVRRLDSRVLSLDPGELEIICIVDQCIDITFKQYLILIDDLEAQTKSGLLGMSSLDVLTFLFFCNERNLLSKNDAICALSTLKSNNYHIDDGFEHDFVKRLRDLSVE